MRGYQYRTHQWLQGKAWQACTPVGPWLVTADEIPDVSQLTVRTTVNGRVVQESSAALMIFDIATLVSTISEFTALEPGDLILTRTPSGVGFRREPPLLLGDGASWWWRSTASDGCATGSSASADARRGVVLAHRARPGHQRLKLGVEGSAMARRTASPCAWRRGR